MSGSGWETEGNVDELIGRGRGSSWPMFLRAKNKTSKLSGIDLAVCVDELLPGSERFKFRVRLMSEIASLLKADRVDLVALKNGPSTLNFEIIKSRPTQEIEVEYRITSACLDGGCCDKRARERSSTGFPRRA